MPKQNRKRLLKLLEINSVIELRCFDTEHKKATPERPVVWSSWFDDIDCLVQAALFAESRNMDIYHTINPLKIPATNEKLKPFQRTARDNDVTGIRQIFFDFDAKRETGTAATDEQVNLAMGVADDLSLYLKQEHGWNLPDIGLSGNGVHLYYFLENELEITKETQLLIRGLYEGLKKRFDNETVSFDVTVKNPARICRMMGSMNKKASRRSTGFLAGNTVAIESVIACAEQITPPKAKKTWVKPDNPQKAGRYIKNLDVVSLFSKNGLYLRETNDPGKHWVHCPWESEHSFVGDTDSVIWEGEWPSYHCSHNSCQGRDISDVIAILS